PPSLRRPPPIAALLSRRSSGRLVSAVYMHADAQRLAVIKGTQASAGALTLEASTALEEILLWLSWLRSEGYLRDPVSRQEMARLRRSLERSSAPGPAA